MSSSFPLTAAQLSGNFCETLFYGIYLVTCAFCARTLLTVRRGKEERWAQSSEIRWMLAAVAIVLFVIQTFNVSIGLLHNFHAFVDSSNPEAEFVSSSNWISVTRALIQNIVTMIGDTVLIYRCWVVHARRWLVVLPSILLYLGCLAMTGWMMELEARVVNPNAPLSSDDFRDNLLAFTALTAAQNILTTTLLIWRIWRVEKASESGIDLTGSITKRPRPLRRVVRVIAESGAIYTLSDLVTFIVIAKGSNAMYPASNITLQLTGITYNVILIRCSPSRDQQFTYFDESERTEQMVCVPGVSETTLGTEREVSSQTGARDVEGVVLEVEAFNIGEKNSESGSSELSGDTKSATITDKC